MRTRLAIKYVGRAMLAVLLACSYPLRLRLSRKIAKPLPATSRSSCLPMRASRRLWTTTPSGRTPRAAIHSELGSPDHKQQLVGAAYAGASTGFDIINRSVSTRTGIPFIRLNCEPSSDPTWYVYLASDYELEAPVAMTIGPDRARFTLGAYTKAVVDWQGTSRTETFVYTRTDDDAEDIVYRLSEYGKEAEWDTFIKVVLTDANGLIVTTYFDVDLMHTTLDNYGGQMAVLALPPAENRSRNCHVAVE